MHKLICLILISTLLGACAQDGNCVRNLITNSCNQPTVNPPTKDYKDTTPCAKHDCDAPISEGSK